MKKFTMFMALLLVCACFVLSGCSPKLDMPNNYTNVVSNGGFVVSAGNYMYFGNGYKGYSSLTDGDNDGNVNQYSLNRIKLDKTTHPNSTWFKLEKEDDEYNLEKVAEKITAYETNNLYVVDQYLYFTSPNIHKNNKNEHEYNLSSLFRIKLDGTGLKELYTTETAEAKFYLTGSEEQKLLIFDDNKIKVLNVYKNETKVKDLTKDIKVNDLVFPKNQEDLTYLYFTTDRDDEYQGNYLYKVNIADGEATRIKNINLYNEKVTILDYEYGVLVYSKNGGNYSAIYTTTDNFASNPTRNLYFDDDNKITSVLYVKCENQNNDCLAFVYNDNLYIQLLTSTNIAQAEKLSDKSVKIQLTNNGVIYYSTDSGLYKVSVLEKTEKQISNITNFVKEAVDFDGRYVYFYGRGDNLSSEADTDYLYRADTYLDEIKTECIAKLLDKDIKEETEE